MKVGWQYYEHSAYQYIVLSKDGRKYNHCIGYIGYIPLSEKNKTFCKQESIKIADDIASEFEMTCKERQLLIAILEKYIKNYTKIFVL